MWHCVPAGIAHPSENSTNSSASSSVQGRLLFKCDSVCVCRSLMCTAFSCSPYVLFTKWAIGLLGMAGTEGMLW